MNTQDVDEDTVFDIVESTTTPRRLVCLLAMRPVVVVVDVAEGGGAVSLVGVVPLVSHPLFATFDADGTLVCGCADGVLRTVSLAAVTGGVAGAPVAEPAWIGAVNKALAPVVPGEFVRVCVRVCV